jgi:ATP/maltotriose-dependent transcriptional regulator MalT
VREQGVSIFMQDLTGQDPSGSVCTAEPIADELQDPPVFVQPLTERERAVVACLESDLTNAQIANQLLVSVNTVKTHLKSVFRKLGVERRQDVYPRARQLGMV